MKIKKVPISSLTSPPSNPISFCHYKSILLIFSSSLNCQYNFLLHLKALPPDLTYDAFLKQLTHIEINSFYDYYAYFYNSTEEKSLAIANFALFTKIYPPLNFLTSIFKGDLQNISILASENEFNSQVFLIFEYLLRNYVEEALDLIVNLLKNYGIRILYDGIFVRTSAWILLAGIIDLMGIDIKEKIKFLKDDFILGEEFQNFLEDFVNGGAPEKEKITKFLEKLNRGKKLRNSSLLYVQFSRIFENGEEAKLIEKVQESKNSGQELASFEEYFMKLEKNKNLSIIDLVSPNLIDKYCIPHGMIGLANKALADFNLGESYKLYKLLYFMGIYEVSGILFHLHYILGSLDEATLVLKRMRENKMEGTFLKEAQLLIKFGKKKEIAKFLKENWVDVKIEGDLIGKYSLQLTTYLMGKCTDEDIYYELCLFSCLNDEDLNVFTIFLIAKMVGKGIFKSINNKQSYKILGLMKNIRPTFLYEYLTLLYHHQKIKKNETDSSKNKSAENSNLTNKQIVLNILDIDMNALKNDLILKIRNLAEKRNSQSDFIFKLAEKSIFPSLEDFKLENVLNNIKTLITEGKERLENLSMLHSLNSDWLFKFINQQKSKKEEKTETPLDLQLRKSENKTEMSSPANEIFSELASGSIKTNDLIHSEILNSALSKKNENNTIEELPEILTMNDLTPVEVDCPGPKLKFVINQTGHKVEMNPLFQKGSNFQSNNYLFYQPFSLQIYGRYQDPNTNELLILTEITVSNLDEYIKSNFSFEQKICLLVQLTYFVASFNCSGLQALFLFKDLLYLTEDNLIKIAPLNCIFDLMENLDLERTAPEMWFNIENLKYFIDDKKFEKIDSWILGCVFSEIVFGFKYKDFLLKINEDEDEKRDIGQILLMRIKDSLKNNYDFNINKIKNIKITKIGSIQKTDEQALPVKTELDSNQNIENNNNANEIVESNKESSQYKSIKKSKDKYDGSPYKQTSPKENFSVSNSLKILNKTRNSVSSIKKTNEKSPNLETMIVPSPDSNTENLPLDKCIKVSEFEEFVASLIKRCTSFDVEERPKPFEILQEIDRFYKSKQFKSKGICMFVPKSLTISEVISTSKSRASYTKKTNKSSLTYLGNDMQVLETPDHTQIKTPCFTILEEKMKLEDKKIIKFSDSIFFEGEFSGCNPTKGVFSILSEERKFEANFERKTFLPDKKSRREILTVDEDALMAWEFVVKRMQNSEDNLNLIDISNHNFSCLYDNSSFPTSNIDNPLLMIHFFTIFTIYNGRAYLFDFGRCLFYSFELESQENLNYSFFDVIKSIIKKPRVTLSSFGGFKFFGTLSQNEPDKGTLLFNSTNILELNGKKNIDQPYNCKLKYPNGDYYEGEVFNGRYNGKGIYYNVDNCKFEGEFKDDVFVNGTIRFLNSPVFTKYEGKTTYDYKSNCYLKNGKGKLYFNNGDIYTGEFDQDFMNGKGTMVFSNNNTYVGEWKKNYQDGSGVLTSSNGEIYEGKFSLGKRHGKGRQIYKNKDIYEGDFFEGFRHGKGVYVFSNGGYYEGEFEKDLKHGNGILKTKENDKFIVKFYKDGIISQKRIRKYDRNSVSPDGKITNNKY